MKKTFVALALAGLMAAAQARDPVALVEPARVELASGAAALTPEQVQQAILRGGTQYGWIAVADEPGKVRLKVDKEHNKHEVVVDVTYDASGFQIRYAGSTNMKYEMVNGKPMIHPFYNTWVGNLSQAIVAQAAALQDAK